MTTTLLLWLVAAGVLLLFLGLFLYWLLVSTEGVFLGRRVVVWLYDLTAHKYDEIKEYRPADERILVTVPVLGALRNVDQPLLLDVATGTGRVPYDLMQSPHFAGCVVGLDDAQKMLAIAAEKLAPYGRRVALVRHPATPLPFPDHCFDAITCLEALEFFPSDENALREMVRVLKPGRRLLTTRRRGWEGRLFLSRFRSKENLKQLLLNLGLESVQFLPWEVNYDLVIARKPGP
ncbi:MAG TPA: class I SAM-dependent methyltransferase [Candidatus Sulfomarinibacteraceae bacterium]|nr:class I SAM-dependent methyltransferase [Candidatus Sulfomarinibacteraceae bacterium]